MVKNDKGGAGGIESMETFAELSEFLKKHLEIDWEDGKGDTIQGNYIENGIRYRIKLSYVKEKGGSRSTGINFHGATFIGHTNSPLWWDYRYDVKVILGKDEVLKFSGKSDSVMSESVTRALAEHKGGSYLSRSDFLELWEGLLMRIKV